MTNSRGKDSCRQLFKRLEILPINALNCIWWHKNITNNRKLCVYQTIIQSILMCGADVWQIPTREVNKFYLHKWTCYGGRQENQGWKK
jgi:hypothetical protein